MDVSGIVNFAISCIGALGGITGVIALFQTHKGNELAKTANRVAEEANGIAREANALAADANEQSTHANLLADRALDVSRDDLVYGWRVKFDHERGAVVVMNDCPNTAHDVAVTVLAEGHAVVDSRVDEIPAFGEIMLPSEFLLQKTVECEQDRIALNARGGFVSPGPIPYGIRVFIVWTTDLGKRRSHCIEQGIY